MLESGHTERLSLGDILRSGASYLADLMARIVNRIAGLAPTVARMAPVAVAACSGPKVEKIDPKPAAVVEPARTVEKTVDDEPRPIGQFDITFYYVIGEEEVAKLAAKKAAEAAKAAKAANDNDGDGDGDGDGGGDGDGDGEGEGEGEASDDTGSELVAIAPPDLVTVYEPKSCAPIADVTRDFWQQLMLQGTGKLKDGRVVNIWGACPCERKPCFKVTKNQWGLSGSGRPLQPFRTVAVDRSLIKLGSLLYVPLLEGRTMPGRPPWGGFVHDGCVVADDVGGGIIGKQLDLFVGRKGYFLGLSGSRGSHAWARHVPVYDGSKICERKGRKVGRRAASI